MQAVELFAPSNQPDKLMPLVHGDDNKRVPLLLLSQAQEEEDDVEHGEESSMVELCTPENCMWAATWQFCPMLEYGEEHDAYHKRMNETREELRSIHGLDAEAELANILSCEILAEIDRQHTIRTATVVMEIGGVVMRTTFEKYFPPSAYKRGGEMQSPGVCIVEPCGWIEGWPEAAGKSHSEYHGWDKKK